MSPMRLAATAVVLGLLVVVIASSLAASPSQANPAAAAQDAPASHRATTPPAATQLPHTAEPNRRGPSPRATAMAVEATAAPAAGLAPTGPTVVATVASVTDGDTIRVILHGQNVPVRYIGIDTPETHNGLAWMGPEAAAANSALVAGREVVLEKDVSETDRFGRLLRYVWLHDGSDWLLVNLELLRQGYAQVATFPPDVKYIDPLFLEAQAGARDSGLGLWGASPVPTPAAIQPLVPGPGAGCEPSYPTICIPIGTPDLDCGDIDARRFTVLWDVPNPDPHRFDRERDGIGCES
jgi:micrococcal nuclease